MRKHHSSASQWYHNSCFSAFCQFSNISIAYSFFFLYSGYLKSFHFIFGLLRVLSHHSNLNIFSTSQRKQKLIHFNCLIFLPLNYNIFFHYTQIIFSFILTIQWERVLPHQDQFLTWLVSISQNSQLLKIKKKSIYQLPLPLYL